MLETLMTHPVTVERMRRTGSDVYGDDVLVIDRIFVFNGRLDAGRSALHDGDRLTILEDYLLHMPPDIEINIVDRVIIGGEYFSPAGAESVYSSPDSTAFKTIALKKVEG